MPANPTTQEMGDRHEQYLAELFGGTKTRASGSKWFDQGDVRNNHDEPFAFCVDGKSTLGETIGVSRKMIAKIREQSQGESPAFGLRWYGTANLDQVDEDWALLTGDDLGSLLADARAWRILADWLLEDAAGESLRSSDNEDIAAFFRSAVERLKTADSLRQSLADAHEALLSAGERITAQDLELQSLRSRQETPPAALAGRPPKLPWAVIRPFTPQETAQRKAARQRDASGIVTDYAADGTMQTYLFNTVRVERSMNNRPKAFVDDVQCRDADVYDRDGRLQARVWKDNSSGEVG